MRLGRKARTGLGLSLGVLAGIAMMLLPGVLTVTHSPLLTPHGFANGNNGHPETNNSTVTTTSTTRTSSNNSTTTAASGEIHVVNLNSTTPSAPKTDTTQTTKTPPGSIPANLPLTATTPSALTAAGIALLVWTIMIPALALSFVARNWSIRQAKKNLEEYSIA